MFDGQVQTEKMINLLYDVARNYHVIVNITGAMSKRFVYKACNKGCSDVTNANRRVVIVCYFLHARFPMFESRASCVIEISGVVYVPLRRVLGFRLFPRYFVRVASTPPYTLPP